MYVICDLNWEKIDGTFYEQLLQTNINQTEFSVQKVNKIKSNKLYAKWKDSLIRLIKTT